MKSCVELYTFVVSVRRGDSDVRDRDVAKQPGLPQS